MNTIFFLLTLTLVVCITSIFITISCQARDTESSRQGDDRLSLKRRKRNCHGIPSFSSRQYSDHIIVDRLFRIISFRRLTTHSCSFSEVLPLLFLGLGGGSSFFGTTRIMTHPPFFADEPKIARNLRINNNNNCEKEESGNPSQEV
jgi:hypothetical protein